MTRLPFCPLLIAIVAAACVAQASNPLVDQSFSTWKPCAPSCWFGLQPGKSTTEEIRTILKQLPFVDATSLYEDERQWQDDAHARLLTWDCVQPRQRWCGSANISGGVLKALYMSVNYDLSFADAVQRLGPPDRVRYLQDMWQTRCEIDLEWQNRGVSITGTVWKNCPNHQATETNLKVNPQIKVVSVNYASPDVFRWWSNHAAGSYQRWSGFDETPFAILGLIPGDVTLWLIILGSLIMLVILAIKKPRWPSGVYAFILAAIAVFEPTVQFEFSDVLMPTCGAYFVNVLICGVVFVIIAEGIRRVRLR